VTEILLVCRANQCRSPFAAAIGAQLGAERPLRFHSAGLMAGGRPMPQRGRRVGRERGFDFSEHRSRELDLRDLDRYDLILTMSRAHAREVLVDHVEVWPRLFTLKQFSRWLVQHPRPEGVAVGPWLDAVAAERPRKSMLGASGLDDVADPVQAPSDVWRRMADELSEHLRIVVDGLEPRA